MPGASEIKAGEAYLEIVTRIGPRFKQGLARAAARLRAFGQRMARIGRRAGLGIIAFVAVSVREFARYQTALAKVATMLDAQTMPMLKKFGTELRRMAIQFGQPIDVLAEGLFDILSASVPAGEALAALEAGAKAATAGFTDVKTATSAIITTLQSYSGELKNATDASDFLFAVFKKGRVTVEELASSIGNVTGDASVAGLSLGELGASIAAITRVNPNAALAMTRLRAIINTFLGPTDEAADVARELGFELNAATLKTIGLAGVLGKLQGATPEQLKGIFPNIRALSGINALLIEYNQFLKDTSLMQERSGLTAIALEKATNTLSFRFRQLWQTLKDVLIAFGEAFAPQIRERIENIIEKLGDLKTQGKIEAWAKDTAKSLKDVTSAALEAAKAIGAVVSVVRWLNRQGTEAETKRALMNDLFQRRQTQAERFELLKDLQLRIKRGEVDAEGRPIEKEFKHGFLGIGQQGSPLEQDVFTASRRSIAQGVNESAIDILVGRIAIEHRNIEAMRRQLAGLPPLQTPGPKSPKEEAKEAAKAAEAAKPEPEPTPIAKAFQEATRFGMATSRSLSFATTAQLNAPGFGGGMAQRRPASENKQDRIIQELVFIGTKLDEGLLVRLGAE